MRACATIAGTKKAPEALDVRFDVGAGSGPVTVERVSRNLAHAFGQRADEDVPAFVIVGRPTPVALLPKQMERLVFGPELRDAPVDGLSAARIAQSV